MFRVFKISFESDVGKEEACSLFCFEKTVFTFLVSFLFCFFSWRGGVCLRYG